MRSSAGLTKGIVLLAMEMDRVDPIWHVVREPQMWTMTPVAVVGACGWRGIDRTFRLLLEHLDNANLCKPCHELVAQDRLW